MKTRLLKKFAAVAIVAGLAFSGTSAALAGGEGWSDNWEASKKLAKESNKDILIDFTGSDWCGWCIRLNDEVFSKDTFKTEVPKHFVLLELDYPRSKKLSKEIKDQNAKLQKQFAIQGFPTIMLVDADGRPYAKTGYQAGGAEKYVEHLAEKRKIKVKRDAAFSASLKLKGVEKAKKLDEGLTAVGSELAAIGYMPVIEEIIKLDAENKAGLKAKYEGVLQAIKDAAYAKEIQTWFRPLFQLLGQQKYAEAEKFIDDLIAEKKPTGIALQETYYYQGLIYFRQNNKEKALESLRKAAEAKPGSKKAKEIEQIIQSLSR